ncbi:hypothetical protein I9W82_005182 [Candida metapsilosis]|uniref:RGS domain-containing protein n=1 Tax=Candida metapsilosis TaxID=273372 RepID=A0A8H8DBA8_9ASCO|nr:hypothetical protein I9W82_005182 [Candida metapsilosis]
MSQQEHTHNDDTINRVTTPATIESVDSTKSTSPSQSVNQSVTTRLNPDQLPTSPISISSHSSSPVSTSVASSITASPTPFNPLPTRSINFAALNSKARQQSSPNSHPNPRVNTQLPSSQAQSQASTPGTISPIQSAGPSRSQSPIVPPLHDLVNDCFLLTIDKLQDETRTFIANSFHQCVAKLHCEENLEFLIDIYRYEYEYNLKVLSSSLSHNATNNTINSPPPSLSTSLNSKAVLNGFNHNEATSMAKMKLNASSPCIVPSSHAASTTSLARRHQKTSSVASFESLRKKQSIASEDLDPQEVFVSTIDDLDLNAPWDSFGDQHVGEDEEYTDGEEDDEGDQSDPQQPEDYLTKEDLHELNERWIFIMNNYIKHDSPSQINISQKLFKEVVEESSVCKLHDPIILLKARNEVLQILKENCYGSFASKFKKQFSQACDQEACCPCSMEDKKNGTVGPNNNSMLTLEGTETNTTSCTECREIPSMSTTSTTTVSSSMLGDTDKQQQQKQKHHHRHHHFHHHHHHSPRSPDSPSLSSTSSIAASLLGKLSLPKRNRSTTRSHQQQNGNFTSPLYGEMSSPSSNSSSTSNIFGQAKFTNNGDVSPSPSSVSSSLRGIPISTSSRKYQPSSQLQQGSSNNSSGSAYGSNSLPIPRSSNTSPISMNSVTSSAAQQDRDREVNSSGSLLSGGASLGSSLKFWKKKP